MKSVYDQVEENINALAGAQVNWARCATKEELSCARQGQILLPFAGEETIPPEILGDVKGQSVLCLAGAGGLQGPILAAAGAKVTVLDLSEEMLRRDREVSQREGLSMEILHGNMCDLSRFEDETFDLILNPPSLFYVPDVRPVFAECHRVLKKGGRLIVVATNPIAYVCDYVEGAEGGYYKAVNFMPYCSADHPDQGNWIEYGHTMESYLSGQLEQGFILTAYREHQTQDITELYFLTRAIKV